MWQIKKSFPAPEQDRELRPEEMDGEFMTYVLYDYYTC